MDRKEWNEEIEAIKRGDKDAEERIWSAYQMALYEQSVLEQVRQSKAARLQSRPVSVEPVEEREDPTLVDDEPDFPEGVSMGAATPLPSYVTMVDLVKSIESEEEDET